MEKIGRILPAILKGQVRRTEPPLIEILAPLWPCVAGKAMAEHCRPVAFNEGTLTLTTECPTWKAQLQQMAEEIRAEINSYLGRPVVKRLRVLKAAQYGPADYSTAGPGSDEGRARWEDSAAGAAPAFARLGRLSRTKPFGRYGKRVH